MLADSFEPLELNGKGYGLYSEFRPEGSGWGEKSQLKVGGRSLLLSHRVLKRVIASQYSTILSLRRYLTHDVKLEAIDGPQDINPSTTSLRQSVKHETEDDDIKPDPRKLQSPEEGDEFDAMLDDDLDLSGMLAA